MHWTQIVYYVSQGFIYLFSLSEIIIPMASVSFHHRPRLHHLCAESSQHGRCEVASRASSYKQGGWVRVSNVACLGVLGTSCSSRRQYLRCVNSRQDTTSNERFRDNSNFSPALRPFISRGHTRVLRQHNALPANPGVVEEEEQGTPWEGAIIFKRSAAQAQFEYVTTLERLGLTRFSSDKAMTLAFDMGLGKVEVDGIVGTPVLISLDCSKEGRNDIRVDGIIRTALALVCNRCLAPCAERIFASFNLLLTDAPVEEPTQPNLGVVLGDNPHIWSAEADDDAEAELDIDLDDKLHFPREEKELDISKYLRDTIHLEIPAKSLCDNDCPGFCFGCGVNLNTDTCRCGKQKKSKNNVNVEDLLGLNKNKDIWGPLEQLKKQLEEQDRSDRKSVV